MEAFEITKEARFKTALSRLGDFLILAQMPDPQSLAHAQQYEDEMHPIWGGRLDFPRSHGRESQDALETLLKIYQVTETRSTSNRSRAGLFETIRLARRAAGPLTTSCGPIDHSI